MRGLIPILEEIGPLILAVYVMMSKSDPIPIPNSQTGVPETHFLYEFRHLSKATGQGINPLTGFRCPDPIV